MADPNEAPAGLKPIQAYLKIAADHDQRDLIGKLKRIIFSRKFRLKFCTFS